MLKGSSRREGLSPRVRGNLYCGSLVGTQSGSIPARAGEPTATTAWCGSKPVYPRACGGTFQTPRELV